jgi:general secretion pathway protein D
MSRVTVVRLFGCLVLLLCLGLFAARAQQPGGGAATGPGKGGQAQKPKRIVYEVKRGVAKELSELLGKLYRGDPGVQVLPAPAGNALVISAPPAAAEEVLQLLGRLDRRPRTVAIEVFLVEVPRKGKSGKPVPETTALDERQFRGNAEDLLDKLQNLQKKGLIGELKRFRLTAAENQAGSVRVGKSRPYVTGVVARGNGVVTRSVMYRDVGTEIRVTPQLGDDRRIALDVHLTHSDLHAPEDGISLGADENGQAVRATEFVNTKFEGRVTVPSGEAEVAKGVTTHSQSGRGQTLVIVSARLETAEARTGK